VLGLSLGKKKEEKIGIQNQFSNPGFPIEILENHVDFPPVSFFVMTWHLKNNGLELFPNGPRVVPSK